MLKFRWIALSVVRDLMRDVLHSNNLNLPTVKDLEKVEGKPLGDLSPCLWHGQAMQPLIDISDKAAVLEALDEPRKLKS
jgi:hypothetical protein